MVMGFRERRLGCRLYVDRQSDANILEKLDRMLVDGSFPNQTELIKRGIELAYEEVYGESPYLVAELGIEMVRGMQHNHQVAATGKHFIA